MKVFAIVIYMEKFNAQTIPHPLCIFEHYKETWIVLELYGNVIEATAVQMRS